MFMFNLGDQQGQPATLDFLQLPHDTAIPPLVSSTEMVNGMLNLHWFSIPGRSYRLQTTPDLRSSFFDVFTEIDANSDETSMEIPMTDQQGYYRIVLVPE